MEMITGTVKAWFTNDWYGPEELKRDGIKAVGFLGYSNSDMSTHGWTCIGTAEITITLVDQNQMVANKVEALRKEITKTRADAEMKARGLEEKVQQLLAITNEVKS